MAKKAAKSSKKGSKKGPPVNPMAGCGKEKKEKGDKKR